MPMLQVHDSVSGLWGFFSESSHHRPRAFARWRHRAQGAIWRAGSRLAHSRKLSETRPVILLRLMLLFPLLFGSSLLRQMQGGAAWRPLACATSIAGVLLGGCARQSESPPAHAEPRAALDEAKRLRATPIPKPLRSSWKRLDTWQTTKLAALDRGRYVNFSGGEGDFPLVHQGRAAPFVVSDVDHSGVLRAAASLRRDIEKVSGRLPGELGAVPLPSEQIVLLGTLGRHPQIDALVQTGKLDVSAIVGRWETHLITVVEAPFPGVRQALVIAGSDPRGTIFGAYDVAQQIGISPWYFWDDVPVERRAALYVKPGHYSQGEPAVKYRGFFINDENPQLGRWARATFGPAPNPDHPHGFNHELYAHVYELLLRLRGNYLWPAVWGRSLFDDDPRNQALAAEYGVVMGTSHEAPMMRAQDEWNRYGSKDGPYGGTGDFSFVRNQAAIEQYWADGLRRMNGYESLVTVGMRGNGDTEMEDAAGTELMLRIVKRQRELISEVLGEEPQEIPQVWTLYKEVQDYWEAGMRAPEDVTIIWCDDNWGNMRKLPDLREPRRAGGYGLYYHFDYVGGGRNYKWVDTTSLPNLWEQLHLSYQHGVDRVWVTNVGDLKNNEHPLEFFLDYAWDPERLPIERLRQWEVQWATAQFGPAYAEAIADVLEEYANLQSRRKPELLNRRIALDPNFDLRSKDQLEQAVVYTQESPFSLIHYRELERVVEEWRALRRRAERVRAQLPKAYDDAYFQLVHYAVVASANVYELRLAQFKNLMYAKQQRSATNPMARLAEALFEKDKALSEYYNTKLAGGKWQHWQTQPKLAYGGPYPNSSWQQPEVNYDAAEDFIWPELRSIHIPKPARLAVAVEGSEHVWPGPSQAAVLPEFSPYQTQPPQYVEVVNLGREAFDYQVTASVPWLKAEPAAGRVEQEQRVELYVDWGNAPYGRSEVPIRVEGAGSEVTVVAQVSKPRLGVEKLAGFVEANGVISMEAEHFDRTVSRGGVRWKLIPNIGRTGSGLTPFPVNAPRQNLDAGSPRLEYDIHTFSSGAITVWAYLSPRNNVLPTDGLKYAVSVDDEAPQVANVTTQLNGIPMNRSWERNTSDNVARVATHHHLERPGPHVLKFWMVDPTVIVQKLVIDTGGLRESYLGPPESYHADGVGGAD